MSTKHMSHLLGKTMTLHDQRTGTSYDATIKDVKESYGNLRIKVANDQPYYDPRWFQPTATELGSVR